MLKKGVWPTKLLDGKTCNRHITECPISILHYHLVLLFPVTMH